MRTFSLLLLVWLPFLGQAAALNAQSVSELDPLDLTPEMKSWARQVAPSSAPVELRIRLLMRALISDRGEGLQEVSDQTATAIEAFESREANCVAFALLFVALSREVEVPTYFVMTTSPEEMEERGDLRVAVRHLAVGYGSRERPQVLDFGGKSRPKPGQIEVLADEVATAIYFSNQGTQHLLKGDAAAALPWLELAVEWAPDLKAAQENLSVARRRLGRIQPLQQLADLTSTPSTRRSP